MFSNYKLFVIFFVFWNVCINSKTCGSELRALSLKSNQLNIMNHRVKRDGGAIPFRPLFVYRAQQKELKAKWKLIEEQKRLKQQQLELENERQNQQNIIQDHIQHLSIPTKSYYNYRFNPVYAIYQANPTFPANDQKEQGYASVNSYANPTYFRPSYVYRQNPYYDEYYSDYLSQDYSR